MSKTQPDAGHARGEALSGPLVVVVGVVVVAGLLFGYDQGVISGARWQARSPAASWPTGWAAGRRC
jgi:hypothetical protein